LGREVHARPIRLKGDFGEGHDGSPLRSGPSSSTAQDTVEYDPPDRRGLDQEVDRLKVESFRFSTDRPSISPRPPRSPSRSTPLMR
jgi:hypothetical protein